MRDAVVDYVHYWKDRTEFPVKRFIAWLGVREGKFYEWKNRYGKVNEHNGQIPRDWWLEDWEKQAIVDFHLQYPLEGYRRLCFMMLDRDIVAVGRPHMDGQILAYEGFTAGNLNTLVPMLFKDAWGGDYDAALYLQNVDNNTANLTIRFYDNTGTETCTQVDTLARSAYLRYREALGEAIAEIPPGLYPGEYLKDVGAALAGRDGERWRDLPEAEWLPAVRAFAIEAMMDLIRADLDAAGIHPDLFAS